MRECGRSSEAEGPDPLVHVEPGNMPEYRVNWAPNTEAQANRAAAVSWTTARRRLR